jgi:hypothetical protein
METLATDLAAPTSFGIVTVTGFAPVAVTSGTQYWLVVTGAAGGQNFGYWAGGGSPAVIGELDSTPDGAGPWDAPTTSVSPQFAIDGTVTPVPEPSMPILVGIALAGLTLLRHRRRA